MEQAEKPKRRALTTKVIPDYDHIFDSPEGVGKSGRKPKLFRKLLKTNTKPLVYSTLVYFLQASPTWILPLVTAYIINLVTGAVVGGGGVTDDVWIKLAISFGIIVVLLAQNVPTTMWRSTMISKMLRRTSAGIKSSVVRKLQSLSITYHKDMQTGRIQSKFLKDTDQVDQLLYTFAHIMIPCIVSVIMAVIISVYKNGVVALFFLLVVPVNLSLTFLFRNRIRAGYKDFRIKTEDVSNKLSNMLAMMMVTKSHGLEQVEIRQFNRSISKLTGSGIQVDKTSAIFGASSWAVNTAMSVVCLVFCAAMALLGYIEVGDIVLYQSMFSQINGGVSGLINVTPTMSSGFEALNSVSEIMNANEVEMNIGKKNVPSIKGAITFNDVWYTYPGMQSPVIKGLNLDVKPGECVAFVGSSGSGKSTIMNLIIGFLIPNQGDMLVDGKSIKDINLSNYRHFISVVPQNSILFAGTIRENITYGMAKYSEEDLQRVVEMANLKELIDSLPDGLNTVIGEHGDKLSGGQKQRVTIARALIRNPRIIILDEATSALDNVSEYHVQKAISSAIKDRTTFIVAHRLSTIRNADRIVVMEDGVAVETGTYDELMAKKGRFFELKSLNDFNQKTADEALA